MLEIDIKVKEHTTDFDIAKPLQKSARYLVSKTQDRIAHGTYQQNAPLTVALKRSSKPLADTGLLLSSITYRTESDKAIVGTNRQGARINNEGGVITAKKSRLWIPASRMIKNLVLSLGTTGALNALKKQGKVYFRKNAVIYQAKGKRPQVAWILKKSVTIPQRRFMYIDNKDREKISGYFKDLIDESDT